MQIQPDPCDFELEDEEFMIFWNLVGKNKLYLNEHEVLYLEDSSGNGRIVIPAHDRQTVLQHLHYSRTGRHLSDREMISRARKVCYWPYMERDITYYRYLCCVFECCHTILTQLGSQQVPLSPFQKVSVCACDPLNPLGQHNIHNHRISPLRSTTYGSFLSPNSSSDSFSFSQPASSSKLSNNTTPTTNSKPSPTPLKPILKRSKPLKSILKHSKSTTRVNFHSSRSSSPAYMASAIAFSSSSSHATPSFFPLINENRFPVTYRDGMIYLPKYDIYLPDKKKFLPEDVFSYQYDDRTDTVFIETSKGIYQVVPYIDISNIMT